MILLTVGADMLAKLMRADDRGPDSQWLLTGPTSPDAVTEPEALNDNDWPLAAE